MILLKSEPAVKLAKSYKGPTGVLLTPCRLSFPRLSPPVLTLFVPSNQLLCYVATTFGNKTLVDVEAEIMAYMDVRKNICRT